MRNIVKRQRLTPPVFGPFFTHLIPANGKFPHRRLNSIKILPRIDIHPPAFLIFDILKYLHTYILPIEPAQTPVNLRRTYHLAFQMTLWYNSRFGSEGTRKVENKPQNLDADILQCKADLLKVLQQSGRLSPPDNKIQNSDNPNNTPEISQNEPILPNNQPKNANLQNEPIAPDNVPDVFVQNEPILSEQSPADILQNEPIFQHSEPDIAPEAPQPDWQNIVREKDRQLNQLNLDMDKLLSQLNEQTLQNQVQEKQLALALRDKQQQQQSLLAAQRQIQETTLAIKESVNQTQQFSLQSAGLAAELDAAKKELAEQSLLIEQTSRWQQRIEQLHQELEDSRRDLSVSRKETEQLQSRLSAQMEAQTAAAAELDEENQFLRNTIDSLNQQIDTLKAQAQQADEKATDLEKLYKEQKLRIQILTEQTDSEKQQQDSVIGDLTAQIDVYRQNRQRFEKTIKDLENRTASLQSENDRLSAAQQDLDAANHQSQQVRQLLEMTARECEKLKGQLHLQQEENTRQYDLLRLREMELSQQKEAKDALKEENARLRQFAEVPQSMDSHEQPDETADVQPADDRPAAHDEQPIPTFNLAEQIMAEQRRAIGSQRQSPAGRTASPRTGGIQNVVNQFVNPSAQSNLDADVSHQPPAMDTPVPLQEHQLIFQSVEEALSPVENRIIEEIVRRDILRLLEPDSHNRPRYLQRWIK